MLHCECGAKLGVEGIRQADSLVIEMNAIWITSDADPCPSDPPRVGSNLTPAGRLPSTG